MRSKLYLVFLLVASGLASSAKGQSYSTFESQPLVGTDTFYSNYSSPGTNVGFLDGPLYFPCVYDTGFGYQYWSSGFAYSNVRDSITSGFGNQYAARPGGGFNSSNYAVSYGQGNKIKVDHSQVDLISGFYVSNTTYTYKSMRDGDFVAKKFGGLTGNDPDYFILKINRFAGGVLDTNTLRISLADFRDTNNIADFILETWQYVPLRFTQQSSTFLMDSLLLTLESSDTGQFGINTPLYFAVDSFTSYRRESVKNIHADLITVYPNPASKQFIIESKNRNYIPAITVYDMAGREMKRLMAGRSRYEVDMEGWPSGMYMVKAEGAEGVQTIKILKQ